MLIISNGDIIRNHFHNLKPQVSFEYSKSPKVKFNSVGITFTFKYEHITEFEIMIENKINFTNSQIKLK